MNADILAEEIVEAENIDVVNLDLKKHDFTSKNADYIVNGDIKVIRKSIEDYFENINNIIKKWITYKWNKTSSFVINWFWNTSKFNWL